MPQQILRHLDGIDDRAVRTHERHTRGSGVPVTWLSPPYARVRYYMLADLAPADGPGQVAWPVSRPASHPRCYRLPPHKPLPSREALVLWIGLQPLWQVADIWPLRPADNRPNPCGTQFPHPKTRAAILRQAEPFDCHPKTAPTRLFISMRRSDKKAYHPSPDRVTTIEDGCTNHTHFSTLVQVRPARSIFSNPLNFCRSAIAALVRSPWRYCRPDLVLEIVRNESAGILRW